MTISKSTKMFGFLIFALTALITNINFYSTSFITENRVVLSRDMDNTNSRQIASFNRELLSGIWSIYAVIENDHVEHLEAEVLLTPSENEIIVTFAGGEEEIFKISNESGFSLNNVTLCRDLDEHTTECIKATRGELEPTPTPEKIRPIPEKSISAKRPAASKKIRGLKMDPEKRLILYPFMAIDPKGPQNPVPEELISGEMVISNFIIEELDITVDEKSLKISDVPIKQGAMIQFKDIDGILNMGVINNNGNKETFSLRFSTGVLKGVTIKFATTEALRIQEEKQELALIRRKAAEEDKLAAVAEASKGGFSDPAVLGQLYSDADREQINALRARNLSQEEEDQNSIDNPKGPPTYYNGFKFSDN